MSQIFNDFDPLARGLDAAALRHKILAGNLANANTPGYTRFDVRFEELLREKLRGATGPEKLRRALEEIRPKVVSDPSGPFDANGNNVTLEKETGQITRNEILYNIYAEVLSLKIGQLRHVIQSTK